MVNSNAYAIVADVGGTFARFSRVHLETLALDEVAIYRCAEYNSFESVLVTYQTQSGLEDIKCVAIAIACPISDDWVNMTNGPWQFSIRELKQKLNLHELKVINDFNAIAMSLPVLKEHQVRQIGQGQADNNKVKVVLGAGTGLGLAYLVPSSKRYVAFAGEGGHASWGAKTQREWFIYNELKQYYDHVSYERLLSGHGLENLYKALLRFHNQTMPALQASEIISQALSQQNSIAEETIVQFFSVLGVYAGDMALTFGAFGGVYIAGGIVPRLLSLIEQSNFRANFEDKGRFSEFSAQMATFVITEEQPGLLGAAVSLKQNSVGECYVPS